MSKTVSEDDIPLGKDLTKWIVSLVVNGTIVPFKLDLGARVNLINIWEVKALKERPVVKKRTLPLKAYNGQPIETQGENTGERKDSELNVCCGSKWP